MRFGVPSFYPIDRPGLRWAGIFAHRQYKGLIEQGAELQVILPVYGTRHFLFLGYTHNGKNYNRLTTR